MQKWDWSDEICIKIFLNEFLQSLLFRCQKRVYKANRRLSIFFQIDFKVIEMMRSKNFNFSFAENIGKFVILRRNIGKVRSFCKFCVRVKNNRLYFILFLFLFSFIFLYFFIGDQRQRRQKVILSHVMVTEVTCSCDMRQQHRMF